MTSQEVSAAIDWQFRVRTYLEAQGLQFMANEVTKAVNMLINLRERLEDEHKAYIDRIHP